MRDFEGRTVLVTGASGGISGAGWPPGAPT
jgi:NAD(P)-dependent dehydrogenase (short-subunit alcohol dehydrogenase family)